MNKKLFLGILLSLCTAFAAGQEKDANKHVFSVQAGYGNLLKSPKLLTQSTDAYRSGMRDGVAWNASYYFLPIPELGLGMLYAGHSSKSSHQDGADHLFTHYVAPQLAFLPLNSQKFTLGIHAGIGYFHYLNNSEVFGKSRKVSDSVLGFNVGAKAEYKLTTHWGIGINALLITADSHTSHVKYHGEEVDVNQINYLRPFSITGGIQYHF